MRHALRARSGSPAGSACKGRVAAAGAPSQLCRGARGTQKEVAGLGIARLGREEFVSSVGMLMPRPSRGVGVGVSARRCHGGSRRSLCAHVAGLRKGVAGWWRKPRRKSADASDALAAPLQRQGHRTHRRAPPSHADPGQGVPGSDRGWVSWEWETASAMAIATLCRGTVYPKAGIR